MSIYFDLLLINFLLLQTLEILIHVASHSVILTIHMHKLNACIWWEWHYLWSYMD